MEKYEAAILIIIGVVSLAGLLLTATLTGQSYRYAQNFGPQGQQPSHANDIAFGIPNALDLYPEPSNRMACCSFTKIAEYGANGCSMSQEVFETACTMDEEEGAYLMPPCPPNHLLCNFPR